MRRLGLVLLLMLAWAPPAHAGWPPAGGGPVNSASAKASGSYTATVGGVPFVGWSDPGGTVAVAKLVGDAWTPIAAPPKGTSAYAATLGGMVAAGGKLWLVWSEADDTHFQVLASSFDGTSWSGAVVLNENAAAEAFDPTLATVGDQPYAVWTERDATGAASGRVKRFALGAWSAVGGHVTHDATHEAVEFALADVGGVPHVVYTQFEADNGPLGLRVVRLGTAGNPPADAWTDVGGIVNDTARLPYHATIASLGGQPAIAWEDVSDTPFTRTTRVARHSSGAWSALGTAVGTHGQLVGVRYSLREYDGVPFLGYTDSQRATVAGFDGTAWSTVDAPLDSGAGVDSKWPQLSQYAGKPFATWTEAPDNDFPFPVSIFGGGRQPDTVRLAAATATVAEGGGSIALDVQRIGALAGEVTVGYAVGSGTAKAGEDFTGASGPMTFAPGEATKTVTVPILDDGLREGDETFTLTIGVPTGDAVLGSPSKQTVTITDDDAVDTVISFGPQGYTTEARASFLFASNPDGRALACSLDGAAEAPCTSPLTIDPLAEGAHTFRVRADGDPTPAEREFFVDSVRPTAALAVSGAKLTGGKYTGPVTVRATGADAGSGVKEVRCAVDPPVAPQSASDLRGECPVTVTAAGSHTVYAAAVDQAGWVGIPVAETFAIADVPDTTITAGPSGPTWLTVSSFTFTSSTAGATFRCRVDAGPTGPCTSPLSTGPLESGDHVFEVAAVSPEGAVDPTPALGAWHVNETTTTGGDLRCRLQPVPFDAAWFLGDLGSGVGGCEVSTPCPRVNAVSRGCFLPQYDESFPRSTAGYSHRSVTTVCPRGAACTLTLTVSFFDADPESIWGVVGTVDMFALDRDQGSSGVRYAECESGLTADRCTATASVSLLGDDDGVGIACLAGKSDFSPPKGKRGPDNVRRLECAGSLRIAPAQPLQTVPAGAALQVNAPAAGTLAIAPAAPGSRRAVAARKAPVFSPARRIVPAAGAVTFTPKLAGRAKRTLRKRRKLPIRLRITFAPADGGTPLVATRRVTLRADPKPRRDCRRVGRRRQCKAVG